MFHSLNIELTFSSLSPNLVILLVVAGQTTDVLAKIDDFLAKAGTSKSHLLTASIWLKDISTDFEPMNAVCNEWLDPLNKPVRATVEANVSGPQILVEIQVTAATKELTWQQYKLDLYLNTG